MKLKNISKLLLAILLAGIFYIACNPADSKLEKLEWILGNWETQSGIGTFYEKWIPVNDTLFEGSGLYIIEGDTSFTEKLSITYNNDEINYIAIPSGQAETAFKLVQSEPKKAVFENLQHDFPTRITYVRTYKDSLTARVEGKIDGKEVINQYNWGKQK